MGGMRFDSPVAPCTRSAVVGFVSSLLLAGCITGPSSIGDFEEEGKTTAAASSGETGGSTGEPETTTVTVNDGGSTAGDDSPIDSATSGMPFLCGPQSQCTLPLECAPEGEEPCGGALARADADGCPRMPCEAPGDCPGGTTCFFPNEWGYCGLHECQDDDVGLCECGFGLDCNDNALCVPDEEVPDAPGGDAYCGQLEDETSCTVNELDPGLGRCQWYEGFTLAGGETCGAQVPTARCVYARNSLTGPTGIPPCPSDETLHPMMLPDGDDITVLFVDPDFPPFIGFESPPEWQWCTEDPERCFCGCPE